MASSKESVPTTRAPPGCTRTAVTRSDSPPCGPTTSMPTRARTPAIFSGRRESACEADSWPQVSGKARLSRNVAAANRHARIRRKGGLRPGVIVPAQDLHGLKRFLRIEKLDGGRGGAHHFGIRAIGPAQTSTRAQRIDRHPGTNRNARRQRARELPRI